MTTVTLGDFTFGRFEIPENIPFGVSQTTNVHRLVGGKRIIDVLGRDPHPLSWSGWFVGENAMAAARYLKTMVEAGKTVPLTWDELAYTVIITELSCDFRLPWRIPYQIRCEVVTDDTAPLDDVPPLSAEQLVNDDFADASTLSSLIGDTTLTGLMGTLGSAVTAVGDFATASVSAIAALATPIAAARAQVGNLMGAAESIVSAPMGVAGILAGADPIMMAASLPAYVATATQSPSLVMLDRTLGRMAANIAAVGSGTTTLLTIGGNLFQIATEQFGDPMLWTALAQANKLTDPSLSGITTLVIPPRPSSGTGGVLNG